MTLEHGYHIMSPETADEIGRSGTTMSIVEFLRQVHQRETLPIDITVYGLDDYLVVAEDPDQACQRIHELLRDRASHLSRERPCVQFVVDDIERWNERPIIRSDDHKIDLKQIFPQLSQGKSKHYSCTNLNVAS